MSGSVQTFSVYYLVNHLFSRLDFEGKEDKNRKLAAAAILRQLDPQEKDGEGNEKSRRPRKEDLILNQYEQLIAMDVVAPNDIAVSFEGRLRSRSNGSTDSSWQTLVDWVISSRSLKSRSSTL